MRRNERFCESEDSRASKLELQDMKGANIEPHVVDSFT